MPTEMICSECGARLPLSIEPSGDVRRCERCQLTSHLSRASAKKDEDDGRFTDSPPPAPRPKKTPRRDADERSVAKAGGSSALMWIFLALGFVVISLLCVAGAGSMALIFLLRAERVDVAQRAQADELVAVKKAKEAEAKANADGRPLDDGKDAKINPGRPANDRAIIRDVMRKAMNKGAGRDFAMGKATDEQKQQLLAMMTDFAATRSPKGNDDDWNARTGALLTAVKANDVAAYKKASDCAGCHQMHKGKK